MKISTTQTFISIEFFIALKRKLQTRRSLKQLVDVGIMPPPKAPLPFYEQRKQLQMRKVCSMKQKHIVRLLRHGFFFRPKIS